MPTAHAPEILLHLADEATALWQKTEEELGEIGLPPPFWAFAWAGGQALARYILDHPETVASKTVLDFASGSGLVAIAAAKAGAARVEACDIDAYALAAMPLNAAANAVTIFPRAKLDIGADEGWDVVLAGDISYEQDTARAVTDWLQTLHRRGARVLIGDPGRTYLARDRLEAIAEYRVPVTRALEDCDIKRACVWRFKS
jgi:predicted nicotinamide N-methyase